MSTLKLKGSSSGEAEVTVAAAAGTPTITLPTASINLATAGDDGQYLKTNGSGTLSFDTPGTDVVWWGTQDTAHALTQNTAVKLVNLGNDAINTTGWDEATGTFTVPSGKGGTYVLTAACGIDHMDSNEKLTIYVYVNGSEVGPKGYTISDTTSDQIKQVNATWIRSLSASDTVAIWATTTENDGGITTVADMTWFGGYKIA